MSDEEAPEPAMAPGRLAVRSPLEAYLWIFITRLIALLTASRPSALPAPRPDAAAAPGSGGTDPARARRVAASRPADPAGKPPSATTPSPAARQTERTRAVTITAATAVVGAAAAFAVGRRRGAR